MPVWMPRVLQGRYCGLYLFDGDAAFHRIQHPLRTALGTDPNTETSKLREQIDDFVVQAVGPRNTFEWNAQTATPHFRGYVLPQPAVVNGENVVGDPHHFGMVGGK